MANPGKRISETPPQNNEVNLERPEMDLGLKKQGEEQYVMWGEMKDRLTYAFICISSVWKKI